MPKHPSRAESGETQNPTIGLPNLHFTHDMADGFPLLTTRRIAWKNMVGELRTFLEGRANGRDFKDNGCNFWGPWAALHPEGELGPVYGAQWVAHGQLDHVLKCLRERPEDRRMVVSAWRPDEHWQMALPPCHFAWVVTPYGGKLNVSWFQRSCDFPVGVPYNIASYGLLTLLLAAWADMEPGQIDCIFCDAHIYTNQLDGVDEQLSRIPRTLPKVTVGFDDHRDFLSWDAKLEGWNPYPDVDFGDIEV
jgi:thymidylate synthase